MHRFAAIVQKEFRQIRRDPLSLGLLVCVPALLLVLYGYALTFDVKHVPVAVLDQDRSAESRRQLDSLFQNPYFDRAGTLERIAEADALLSRGRVRAVLVIPPDYAADLARGAAVRIQVLVDGANATTASTVIGYLDVLADRVSRRLRTEALVRQGLDPSLPVVTPEVRVWFNPELVSAQFLIPGLIGVLLMLSAVVATSLSIVREKERETIEQIMVSPVKPEELILGKTLPYVFICLITMALVLGLGYLLFGVVIRGALLALAVATVLFLFAALGMGVLISSITRSQQTAFQIAIIASLLPSIILSGLIFPIRNMPAVIQGLTFLVVPRYFISALRKIILKDAPWSALGTEFAAMLALGVAFNLLAAWNTRKTR
jgi:ABC-2 type transport system permease protein